MAPVLLPPVTKYTLTVLLGLSVSSLFIRYYVYFSSSSSMDESSNANPSAPTPELKQMPLPSEIFLPSLTLAVGHHKITHGYGFVAWLTALLKHPWVFLTSPLVEPTFYSLFLTAVTLAYGGKYCEHVWGSREMARFLSIIAIVPTSITFLAFSALKGLGLIGRMDPSAVNYHKEIYVISGGTGIVCGFLVAFKQHVPEHVVLLFGGRMRLRIQRLPFLFLCIYSILALFGHESAAMTALLGFLLAWVYLRFFRISYVDPVLPFARSSLRSRSLRLSARLASARGAMTQNESTNPFGSPSPSSSAENLSMNVGMAPTTASSILETSGPAQAGIKVKGDACDGFAFHTFFPSPFDVAVEKIAGIVEHALVKLGLWKPFTQSQIEAANASAASRYARSNVYNHALSQNPPQDGLSSSPRAEIERRRSLALRALEQELAQPYPAMLNK